jgi:Glycosyltransferase family 87
MLTRLHRVAAVVVCAAFLIVNLVNAIREGGDFDAYFDAGRRLLGGESLYAGSGVASGFVGPPAQALLFLPFVPLGRPAAYVAWYVVNVILLWYALRTWSSVMISPAGSVADATSRPLNTVPWLVLSMLAVAAPLQTQFEHKNLNIVLLALVAIAAASFRDGRPACGGIAVGVATALKVYPICLLVWLAIRRQWRALAAGTAAAIALSLTPALLRGVDGLEADLADWQVLAGSGWPTRRANQSLAAMWGRYLLGEGVGGYPVLTLDQPLVFLAAALTAGVVVWPLALSWCRHDASPRRLIEECACVNALAVLLSPIAWEHYWIAFFPVFAALGLRARSLSPFNARNSGAARLVACAFWLGVIGITLLSRPLVGWHGARIVRAWSLKTWAGLLLCATLAYLLARRRPRLGDPLERSEA